MRPRVHTASFAGWIDPAEAWSALCAGADAAFWLDSGPHATTGMSYLGVASSVTTDFDGPVFDWLREQTASTGFPEAGQTHSGFTLGWIGYLGYEVRAETMGVEVTRESRYPDAAWMFVDRCLSFNHETREVTALGLDDVEEFARSLADALEGNSRDIVPARASRSVATWAYPDDEYLAMIEACQAAIREGDAYQLCLTTEASVDVSPDPFSTYLALRQSSPTHHGALLVVGDVALLSATPEQFLTVTPQGIVETKPIKGTRPRGDTEHSDAELRHELESSDKERAENLMIVDLMRNDIGRISRVGSVAVTSLLAVESYAQVHQLVSTVRGELAEGLTAIDAIEASFPAGSMTGAPKLSATLILDSLERRARGIYSGVFGYIGLDGAVDLAMVIRSIVIDAHGSTVGAGGGITALSVPTEELAEAKLKAAALLRVLGVEPLAL